LPFTVACAIIDGMTAVKLKIDKAGRIVVPKDLRDRLGMRAGTELEVGETADGLILKRAAVTPSMVLEDGIWVHQGVAPKGFDWEKHIEESRDDRHREISGF
jgi:AbrB family looped-hinge helix DNA binding protein